MSEFDPGAFGALRQKVDIMADNQKDMQKDIKKILGHIERQKGAKWAFGAVAGLSASGITHFIHKITNG